MENTRVDQIKKMIELSNNRMELIMKRPLEKKDATPAEIQMAQKELELQVKLLDLAMKMEKEKAPPKVSPEDEKLVKEIADEFAKRKRSRLKVEKK